MQAFLAAVYPSYRWVSLPLVEWNVHGGDRRQVLLSGQVKMEMAKVSSIDGLLVRAMLGSLKRLLNNDWVAAKFAVCSARESTIGSRMHAPSAVE